MSNVRMPIQTTKDGQKISKVCVEDIYKIINRVYDVMNKAYNNSVDILEGCNKHVNVENTTYEGYLIKGTGNSQPCAGDDFNEEIGNNIAFMKSKLNANIKKRNILVNVYNNYIRLIDSINSEIYKIEDLIELDLIGIRNYNESYLINDYINDELNDSAYVRNYLRSDKMQNRFRKELKIE